MYILVSCCEGNIIVNKYATYDDAYASMEKEYNEFAADCIDIGTCIDMHRIEAYDAFVAYELSYRIDWHIEEM
jgi:hypothetical protein